jgi:hydroxymethylpyrimidine/phosphomethylpyrimidine kinase
VRDLLLTADGFERVYAHERILTNNTHGTGCTLSAAITARLARGEALEHAVRGARAFVRAAIANAPGIGGGCGPVDHFAPVDGE